MVGLLAIGLCAGAGFARRTLRAVCPVVDLGAFRDRNFAIGCVLSFVLGIGLFGSVYLMPVFLAFVRLRDALEIGTIMLATGMAQLAAAPVAVVLERRIDARRLTAAGFAVFAIGLGLSGFQTPQTDRDGMLWPQIVRGLAIMFCLLPPTRLALGRLTAERVPDASGLFNLMRNLGGAIGIALIDSVIYGRVPIHVAGIVDRLRAGDSATAAFIGLSADAFAGRAAGPPDEATQAMLRPLIERAALTLAIDEAWAAIAGLTALAVLCVAFAKRPGPA